MAIIVDVRKTYMGGERGWRLAGFWNGRKIRTYRE